MIKKIYKNNNIIIFLISQEGVRVHTPDIKFYLYQQNNKFCFKQTQLLYYIYIYIYIYIYVKEHLIFFLTRPGKDLLYKKEGGGGPMLSSAYAITYQHKITFQRPRGTGLWGAADGDMLL
jgi:hypothetical protein